MNLRSSAIVMKSLPATAWGDALLISREEARRIGYELEQSQERIEALERALEARAASPKVPQGVEEWIEAHTHEGDGYEVVQDHVHVEDLRAYLSGMALVPVEQKPYECFSTEGDSWFDCPDDIEFVQDISVEGI